jgi:hypothetical protein
MDCYWSVRLACYDTHGDQVYAVTIIMVVL